MLDALRTLAVALMVAAHTTRLIVWEQRRDWSRAVLLIEPFIASLFLYLVGAALAESWSRAEDRPAWFRRHALRALALWALSCLFYVLEEGAFEFPDAPFLSGILATIGYVIVLLLAGLAAPASRWVLLAGAAALFGLHAFLDKHGLRFFMINAGNSPLLPLSIFAFLGAALGPLLRARPRLAAALGLLSGVTLVLLIRRHGLESLFSEPLGRYETARVFGSGPPQARVMKSIPYYNLRPLLAVVVLACILFLQTALAPLRPGLQRIKILFAVGRHSLAAYILHLSFLASIVVLSGRARRPLSKTWQGDAVFLGALAACYIWALGREFLRARRMRLPSPA